MPMVNAQHRVYRKYIARWTMIRDAVEGEYAVKAAGEVYLPKLIEQEQNAYKAYKQRALFFEATGRTLQGLSGMVMRKDPSIEASESTKNGFLKKVTKKGIGIIGFANVVLQEVLMLNKYGILVDLPETITTDSEPWFVGYNAESMINWEFDTDSDGKRILTRMVLEEPYALKDPEDRFKVEEKTQWRVLELVSAEAAQRELSETKDAPAVLFSPNQTNVYRVQVWRKKKDLPGNEGSSAKDDEFVIHETRFPSLRGVSMERIPFIIATSVQEDEDEQKPPMEGLASVNMSHYRSSADLEHGRHFTALPTPYVIGLEKQEKLTIGSAVAWMISGVSGKEVAVGMLEFTGQGLTALEKAMSEKQQQMAILGARLLEEQKKAAEAFQTHELRAAGEHSVLAQTANGTSDAINEALEIVGTWDTSLGKMTISLNTEFVRIGMSPQMLSQLLLALQGSKISFRTFFHKMKEGGMYPDEHTEEQELALIMESPFIDTASDDMEDDDEDDDEEEEDDDAER